MSGKKIEVIRGLEGLKEKYPNLVLTIGNFDGIHIGHQRILRRVVQRARELGGTPMAMSFDPHPVKVLTPERGLKLMTTNEEKARVMEAIGIEKLLLVNFNLEFARLEPDEFVKQILVDKLAPREIIVGHNYAFGKARKGTTAILRRRGKKYGFRLSVVRHAKLKGKVVSSSRTRMKIEKGRVEDAALLLGRPYVLEGAVVKGAGRGAKLLGYPTANINTNNELLPRSGVYAVKAKVSGQVHNGVANIGNNPTFDPGGQNKETLEVHIMGFSGDILGQRIRIYFLQRLRDEEKFPDALSLKKAIARDITEAEKIFKKKNPKLS